MKKRLLNFIIERYSVISFDVFDTLIERNVKVPSDIFEIAGKKVLGENYSEQFRRDRIQAESEARCLSPNGEVILDDIYNLLERKYKEKTIVLKEQEVAEEIKSCTPKKEMISIFYSALNQGKRVYIISDMYLPKPVIQEMLEKCGVSGEEKLYVSNTYGANKISGKLFEIVTREGNLDKKRMLHIGDSLKADCLGAIKAGIVFYHVSRKNRLERMLHS